MGYSYLDDLSEAQREAVVYSGGPSLVIAGAGSGKTRVLIYKILHLLHQGIPPYKIMALTFTNKAANEMKERIEKIVPSVGRHLRMGTFHSVFMRILQEHAELLGFRKNISIYTTSNTKSLIKKLLKEMNLDPKTYSTKLVMSKISKAKNAMLSPSDYKKDNNNFLADRYQNVPLMGDVYKAYCKELKESNAMDFDDLLYFTNILFRDFPDVLALWQNRIDYLLIDEYQDTNYAQDLIAKYLMQKKGNIFVVGDDAQSIYSFRGANIENILNFGETFAHTRIFKLEENYRSTQTIVSAAAHVIKNNREQIPKTVFSNGEQGDKIELNQSASGTREAEWVAMSVDYLLSRSDVRYKDIAILYRKNAQSRLFEEAFFKSGIPFRIRGGKSFFDRKEIQDVLAYFRLMINLDDEEALLRVINYPKRGIGDTTVKKLLQAKTFYDTSVIGLLQDLDNYGVPVSKATATKLKNFAKLIDEMRELLDQGLPLYDLAQSLIALAGIPQDLMADVTPEGASRMENVKELLGSIAEYQETKEEEGIDDLELGSYLRDISLMSDRDSDKTDSEVQDAVSFMTIHSAKGLEFPHVYIVGVEEGCFPSLRNETGDPKELEEERRLFYVAMTRAEKTCHISCAKFRKGYNQSENVLPSRFFGELPKSLMRGRVDLVDQAKNTMLLAQGITSSFRKKERSEMKPSRDVSFGFSKSKLTSQASSSKKKVSLGIVSDKPAVKHERIGDLSVGTKVTHATFGAGEIQGLEGDGSNAKAEVLFSDGSKRKLLLRFAKLEVID